MLITFSNCPSIRFSSKYSSSSSSSFEASSLSRLYWTQQWFRWKMHDWAFQMNGKSHISNVTWMNLKSVKSVHIIRKVYSLYCAWFFGIFLMLVMVRIWDNFWNDFFCIGVTRVEMDWRCSWKRGNHISNVTLTSNLIGSQGLLSHPLHHCSLISKAIESLRRKSKGPECEISSKLCD